MSPVSFYHFTDIRYVAGLEMLVPYFYTAPQPMSETLILNRFCNQLFFPRVRIGRGLGVNIAWARGGGRCKGDGRCVILKYEKGN